MTAGPLPPIKIGLPPIARPDARLFILGSLPGDASLAARRYYAHPTNQFWRLLGHALGEDLQGMEYEERLARLGDRKVGLWDVIASALRPGSLDQAIRSAETNPIDGLLKRFPEVEAIAFNGSAAAAAGRKLLSGHPDIILLDLPSSSAANTRHFDEKVACWGQLARHAGPKTLPEA